MWSESEQGTHPKNGTAWERSLRLRKVYDRRKGGGKARTSIGGKLWGAGNVSSPQGRGRNQQRDGHWFFERLRARGRGKLIHDNGRSMSGPCSSPKGSRASTLSVEVLRMLRQLIISAKWKGRPTRRAKRSTDRFRTGCKSNPVASKNVERANRALAADARAAKKRRKRACEGAPPRFGPPAEGITTRRKDHDTPRQSPSPTCRV